MRKERQRIFESCLVSYNSLQKEIKRQEIDAEQFDDRLLLEHINYEKGTIEMDFFVRDADSLIPVEVKAGDNSTKSLNNLIDSNQYNDILYGIKLCNKNIGFNGKIYTFPYFLTFLLKRFLREKNDN